MVLGESQDVEQHGPGPDEADRLGLRLRQCQTGAEDRAKQREGAVQEVQDSDGEMSTGRGHRNSEESQQALPGQQPVPGRAGQTEREGEEEQGEGADDEQEDVGAGQDSLQASQRLAVLPTSQDSPGCPGRTGSPRSHFPPQTLQPLLTAAVFLLLFKLLNGAFM